MSGNVFFQLIFGAIFISVTNLELELVGLFA